MANRFEWFQMSVNDRSFPVSTFTNGTSERQAAMRLDTDFTVGYVFGHIQRAFGEELPIETIGGIEHYVLEVNVQRASGGDFAKLRKTIPVAAVKSQKQAMYMLAHRVMQDAKGMLFAALDGVEVNTTEPDNDDIPF